MIRRTISLALFVVFGVLALPQSVQAQIPRPGRILKDAGLQVRKAGERMIGDAVACSVGNKECVEEAQKNGAELEITRRVNEFYGEIQTLGGGRWDTSSLIRRLSGKS